VFQCGFVHRVLAWTNNNTYTHVPTTTSSAAATSAKYCSLCSRHGRNPEAPRLLAARISPLSSPATTSARPASTARDSTRRSTTAAGLPFPLTHQPATVDPVRATTTSASTPTSASTSAVPAIITPKAGRTSRQAIALESVHAAQVGSALLPSAVWTLDLTPLRV